MSTFNGGSTMTRPIMQRAKEILAEVAANREALLARAKARAAAQQPPEPKPTRDKAPPN